MALYRRSSTEWDDRHAMLRADSDDRGDLCVRLRKGHRVRRCRGMDRLIVGVALDVVRRGGAPGAEQRRDSFVRRAWSIAVCWHVRSIVAASPHGKLWRTAEFSPGPARAPDPRIHAPRMPERRRCGCGSRHRQNLPRRRPVPCGRFLAADGATIVLAATLQEIALWIPGKVIPYA